MKSKVDEKIEKITRFLKDEGAKKVILFGSRARGDNSKYSDIDIAVSFGRVLPFRRRREIKDIVDDIAGIYSVDLVFMENSEENFRNHIIKEGKTLYDEN